MSSVPPAPIPLAARVALRAALAAVLIAAPGGAWAEDRVEVDLPRTALIAGVGWSAYALSEVFKADLAPESCRWCATNDFDDAVRDGLVWDDRASAKTASDVLGFALAPALAIGLGAFAARADGQLDNVPEDALIVAEATAIAMDLNQLVKLAAGRERPFVRALDPADKELVPNRADSNLSFYSGHTTFTTALAASAGTVATMRGYRWAPLVWGVGLPIAATAGYLRIAADRHYASDVIVGGLIGGAVGVAVPLLLHRRQSGRDVGGIDSAAGAATAGGAVFTLAGRF